MDRGGLLYCFEFIKGNTSVKVGPPINLPVQNIKVHPYHVIDVISIRIHELNTAISVLAFYDDSGRTVTKMKGIAPKGLLHFGVDYLRPGKYTGTATFTKKSYHFKFVKM